MAYTGLVVEYNGTKGAADDGISNSSFIPAYLSSTENDTLNNTELNTEYSTSRPLGGQTRPIVRPIMRVRTALLLPVHFQSLQVIASRASRAIPVMVELSEARMTARRQE